jgi:hypothetical protein
MRPAGILPACCHRASTILDPALNRAMLLRRVIGHVKAQNWTAVALDFVIVVVGILIAFQITEWNDARKTGEREAYVIGQLAADMRVIEQQAERYREIYLGRVAAADRIMAFVASDRDAPEEEAAFLADLSDVMFRLAPIQRSPTFVQLLSSGDVGIIRNDELRDAATRFDREMQVTLRSDEVMIDFWIRYGENLGRKIVLLDAFAEGDVAGRYSVGSYDLAAMRADPAFVSSLSWIRRMHMIAAENNRNITRLSGEMAARLETGR